MSSLFFSRPILLPPFRLVLYLSLSSCTVSFIPPFSASSLPSSYLLSIWASFPSSSSSSSSCCSSSLVLLLFLPSLFPFPFPSLSEGAALHARPLPSPSLLIQPSIHYSIHTDMIRWLCMGPALLLPILGHTHTNTPCPFSTDGSWHRISLKNSVDVVHQRKLATWRSPD